MKRFIKKKQLQRNAEVQQRETKIKTEDKEKKLHKNDAERHRNGRPAWFLPVEPEFFSPLSPHAGRAQNKEIRSAGFLN